MQRTTSDLPILDTRREVPSASDKFTLEAAITSAMQACTAQLRGLGVSQVAFLCVSPASDVYRIGFRWLEGSSHETSRVSEAGSPAAQPSTKAPVQGGLDAVNRGAGGLTAGYVRLPMLSFIEPPTACMLETDTLPAVQRYVPSYAHQLHTFVVQVRTVCMSFMYPSPLPLGSVGGGGRGGMHRMLCSALCTPTRCQSLSLKILGPI